jgi:hypothetical protein
MKCDCEKKLKRYYYSEAKEPIFFKDKLVFEDKAKLLEKIKKQP